MKKTCVASVLVLVGLVFPKLSLGTYVYQIGDTWQATTDWTGGVNPNNDRYGTAGVWSYGYDAGDLTKFTLMTGWNGTASPPRWQADDYCEVAQGYQSPGSNDSSDRIWTSPINGSVRITGTASWLAWGTYFDGTYATIYLRKASTSEVSLVQASTLVTDVNSFTFDVTTPVSAGDLVIFQVSKNGNPYVDQTGWDPVLTAVTVPEPATLTFLGLTGLMMLRRRK